ILSAASTRALLLSHNAAMQTVISVPPGLAYGTPLGGLTIRFSFAYYLGVVSTGKKQKMSNRKQWALSDRALTVLYGCSEVNRLSHYFLPELLLNHKRVLYLDGANQVSPLLIARFARERTLDSSALNSLMRVARA